MGDVTVVMTTYFPEGSVGDARVEYATKSLNALLENLECEDGLRLHIADDGSPVQRRAFIYGLMHQAATYWERQSGVTDVMRGGIGGSLNLALSVMSEDAIWMYTTDDWELTDKLDLAGPLSLLENYGYDLVRLGPVHPDLQCVTRFSSTLGWWLDIHQHYGGFAFATRPFIAKRSMFTNVGPFDEGLNSYETERLYAEKVARSTAKLAYWGGINLAGPWRHLGNECVGYKEVE